MNPHTPAWDWNSPEMTDEYRSSVQSSMNLTTGAIVLKCLVFGTLLIVGIIALVKHLKHSKRR